MSEPSTPTLGSKIDAILTPFVEDEAELQKRLTAIHDEAERLKIEMQQVNEDLAVVQSAKIEALREAAEADPLLSAVFTQSAGPKLVADTEVGADADVDTDDSKREDNEATNPIDGHPLLSHAS